MPSNRERAERFAGVLPHYPDEEKTNAIDLLADCQHWCDERGHDFEELLRVARNHVTFERHPESTEQSAEPRPAERTPEAGSKLYRVKVEETCRLWGEVTVEAPSQYEAGLLAGEEFVPRWEDSAVEERETTILSENGVPVAYSEQGFHHDPSNPYLPTGALPGQEAEPGCEPEDGPDLEP